MSLTEYVNMEDRMRHSVYYTIIDYRMSRKRNSQLVMKMTITTSVNTKENVEGNGGDLR